MYIRRIVRSGHRKWLVVFDEDHCRFSAKPELLKSKQLVNSLEGRVFEETISAM